MVLISEETYSKIPEDILGKINNDQFIVNIPKNGSVNERNTTCEEANINTKKSQCSESPNDDDRSEDFDFRKNNNVKEEIYTADINAVIKQLPKEIKQKSLVLLCCLFRDKLIQKIKKKYIIDGKVCVSKNNMAKLIRNYYNNGTPIDHNTKLFKQILQKSSIPPFIKKKCKKKNKTSGWICINSKHYKRK